MKHNIYFKSFCFAATLLSMFSFKIMAANSVKVNFKGNLIQNPPCDISAPSGGDINVDFDDMVIRKITGSTYRKPVPYKLICDAPDNTGVALTMTGDTATFNTSLLKTSNGNLGLMFYSGASYYPWRVNIDQMRFLNSSHDAIYVNPIVNPAATNVSTGAFTAVATIVATYQ